MRGRRSVGSPSLSARGERSDGFVADHRADPRTADEPAPYREWSGRVRCIAPVGERTELQVSVGASTIGGPGARLSRRPHERCGRFAAAGRQRRVAMERARLLAMAQPMSSLASLNAGRVTATRVLLQPSVPSHGLGGSVELGPVPQGFELRFGADARRTAGESRELFTYVAGEPTRRRRAGGETWTSGPFAEASANSGAAQRSRRRTHRPLAGEPRPFVRASHRWRRRAVSTSNDSGSARGGWLPTAARWRSLRGWAADSRSGPRPISVGECRHSNELFRPFRAGPTRRSNRPIPIPSGSRARKPEIEYARGPVQLSADRFREPAEGRDRERDAGRGQARSRSWIRSLLAEPIAARECGRAECLGIEVAATWTPAGPSVQAGRAWTQARMVGEGRRTFLDGLQAGADAEFRRHAVSWL